MYGVGGLDDVTFFGDVHGLAFLWVEVSPLQLSEWQTGLVKKNVY